MPEGALYVGRPTIFGNPWSRELCVRTNIFRPEAIPKICVTNFRAWLNHGDREYRGAGDYGPFPIYVTLHDRRLELLQRIPELRGKQLACWCRLGKPCHADVLAELANKEPP